MAVPRPDPPKKKNLPAVVDKSSPTASLATLTPMQRLKPIQKRLVIWIAAGKPASQFAVRYHKAIMPGAVGTTSEIKKKARFRVRRWQATADFRDALWDWSVAKIDLAAPSIIDGLIGKAKAGRVDAARLALEISGRHAPNSDIQPAAIQIVLNNVPRPAQNVQIIEGEAEEEVDETDEEAL